jgi:hypothetical protein
MENYFPAIRHIMSYNTLCCQIHYSPVALGPNVKDVGPCFDEALGQEPVVEGVQQDRLDWQALTGDGHIPDLPLGRCDDQYGPVGAHCQVLEHLVFREVRDSSELCERVGCHHCSPFVRS